jgi:hypothetical protein
MAPLKVFQYQNGLELPYPNVFPRSLTQMMFPYQKVAVTPSYTLPISHIITGIVLGPKEATDLQVSSSSTDSISSMSVQFERTSIAGQSAFPTLYDDILSQVLDGKRDELLASKVTVLQLDRSNLQPPRRPESRNHHLQNVLLEPVEETRSRAHGSVSSSVSPTIDEAAQSPFARTLAKMDNAGTRIISARLNEQWNSLDTDNDSYQEVIFEKRLWGITAYQKLTQGKQLQSPIHEILITNRQADRRRILNFHGSLGKYHFCLHNISFENTHFC